MTAAKKLPTPAEIEGRPVHEVVVGKKTVKMIELNMFEVMSLCDHIPNYNDGGARAMMVYAVGSIRFVDGTPVFPLAGATQFQRVAEMFNARDAVALVEFYGRTFGDTESGEELKNELSTPA